jgi:hypothetical protein
MRRSCWTLHRRLATETQEGHRKLSNVETLAIYLKVGVQTAALRCPRQTQRSCV